jgi:Trk K+ transport system NAD-binding subunit
MPNVVRRAGYYVGFILLLLAVSTLVYDFGMRTFEPGPYSRSIFHSLQVVVETITATGYGSDAPWSSPAMNLLIVVLDLTGVALFFIALPAVFLPLFQEAISTSVPRTVDNGVDDHVLICSYTPRAEALIGELRSNDVDYVLVEPDRERAVDLQEDGYEVVHADPESVSDLEDINLADARALVTDVSDRVDASIVLAGREASEDVAIVSVVEEPDKEAYHRLAGADIVLSPRQLLGKGLAQKLTTGVSTDLGDTIHIGEDFDLAEFPIYHGSELIGTSLAESNIREEFGVNVVGAWFQGEFESPPPPNVPLESGTILLVSGHVEQLEELRSVTVSTVREFRRGETVVVGFGEVGGTVARALEESNLPYTVVDRNDREGVDVVGEATDPDVLREAGVEEAQSVVLALPDDTSTEFATLVVRDLNDSAEIIARADSVEDIKKTYRAGADYVLSLGTVSGRSVASAVLDREQVLSPGTSVEVIRTTAPGLVGETLAGAQVRGRTGCTVIAAERNGQIITELGPEFEIIESDELVIAGTDEGTNRFVELFG